MQRQALAGHHNTRTTAACIAVRCSHVILHSLAMQQRRQAMQHNACSHWHDTA
jgi:hypothetical protein